jgi:hypothetical protein
VGWGRERGRDPQLYRLRIFGDPRVDGTWSWRFGGPLGEPLFARHRAVFQADR